ncbi:hypothetical protein [Eubacterium limosum]|uniref:hypothetical protein n=1 Tax=Eubacterium limosum TaxID=1736 RepID=UPI0037247C16
MEGEQKELLKQKLLAVLPAIVSMPFYRKKYQIEGLSNNAAMDYIVDHFYELPFLTRNEVKSITSASIDDGRCSRLMVTGGTSGISNVIEWCDEDIGIMTEQIEKRLSELGVLAGNFMFSTIPVGMSIYGVLIEVINKNLGLRHIEMERLHKESYVIAEVLFEKYKPKLLFTTPALALELCYSPLKKKALKSIEIVVVGGAMSSVKDLESIESELGCRVLDLLGSTEMCVFGLKEKGCEGFHLHEPETVILEIVDRDERGKGKCVMTGLHNKRMPLVRYVTGDMGYLRDQCSCGHKGRVFCLTGRISDTCYLGGTKVSSDCFEHLAKALGFNTTFQALFYPNKNPQHVQMNIVDEPRSWSLEQVTSAMLETNLALRSKILDGAVSFDIGFIKEQDLIGLNERGKWRRVIEQ